MQYYDLICKLESIADRYFQLALAFHQDNKRMDKAALYFLKESVDPVRALGSLCRKFDIGKATMLARSLK